jgi:Sensors of blue-light using FAD
MVRSAQTIYKTAFLSVNNPRTPMADTQAWVLQWVARACLNGVTGMVLAGPDRWLCLLEGSEAQVTTLAAAIERHERPKQWHLLMTDSRAKVRMFPQHRLGWHSQATPLEMAAFLGDLRRNPARSQTWHATIDEVLPLLEPQD